MPIASSVPLEPQWVWSVIGVAGLLLGWTLTPIRLRTAGHPPPSVREGALPIYPLLWVMPPTAIDGLLRKQPGVGGLDLDLRRGVAIVRFDPQVTSLDRLRTFVDNCHRHCAGEHPPAHTCPPELDDAWPLERRR